MSQAEYVIYIYMWDYINRYIVIRAVYKNYDMYFKSSPFERIMLKFSLGRYILSYLKVRKIFANFPNIEEAEKILKIVIETINKKLKIIAINAKQIIIIYDEKIPRNHGDINIYFYQNIMKSKIWKELAANNDITVVHTKELTGFLFDKQYKLKEDIVNWYPNEKAWQVFTPLFVENYIN